MSLATEPLARDAEARRIAQREFEHPVVLEAGAGTGKTTTLVARILAWSLAPGWNRAARKLTAERPEPPTDRDVAARVLQRVVAITFTEAAAAQMAERLSEELARLADGQPPPPWLDLPPLTDDDALPLFSDQLLERRSRSLLTVLDRLTVKTIHAWCLQILADHPLEAGLHPRLTVDADGRLLEEIVHETVEIHLRDAYGTEADETYLGLAGRGIGPREIADALIVLAREGLPSAVLAEDPLGPEGTRGLVRRLRAAVETLHGLIAPRLADASGPRAAPAAERSLAELLRRLTDEPPETVDDLRQLLDDTLDDTARKRLDTWKNKPSKSEEPYLGDVRRQLAAASRTLRDLVRHVESLDPQLLDWGRRALAPLLAEIENRLESRGVITFQGLLSGAVDLVHRHPRVVARLRRGLDQLLVDEFQDTDRLQCDLVAAVALDDAGDRSPPPPGLFLVGDPKQSIYGWRSADLAAYEDFVGRALDRGGRREPLVRNFRSVRPILDEVERAIEPVMHEEPGLQPPFQRLFARDDLADHPGFVDGGRRAVEHWVPWTRDGIADTRKGEANELEAHALAREMKHLHRRHGVAYDDMALLFRSGTAMETYLDALRRAGVPFEVTGDRQYYRRREVIEAASLVRSVLDPGDHLALVTLLRSAMVGVPDAAWIPLWRHDLPRLATELTGPPTRLRDGLERLREAVSAAASEVPREVPGIDRLRGWDVSLLAAFEALASLRWSYQQDPADVFVERLRRAFLTEAVESARYLGAYRLANLERFFRDLAEALEEGRGDETAVLNLLRRRLAEPPEAPEGVPQERADAVTVLTIHRAKGLEFDHVFLPQLHHGKPPDRPPETEVARDPRGRWEIRLFGAATPGFDRVVDARKRRDAAERVRLLYVALTRAARRLVLLGLRDDRLRPVDRASSFADLLGHRRDLPGPLEELWGEGEPGAGWTTEDPAGVLWRFPALRPDEPGPEGDEPEDGKAAPVLPSVDEVARDSLELTELRRSARRESARNVSQPMSEEAHKGLRELLAERVGGEPTPLDRDLRMALGTAIHRALELWNLEAPPDEELQRRRRTLELDLESLVSPGDLADARTAGMDLLEKVVDGDLLARLRELAPHVLARELPVLLPPDADGMEPPPTGFLAGAVDLLYRDPETEELVVADYKTDEVATDDDLAARATVYAPQGRLYAQAVQEALDLPAPPRFELWFLRADRILVPSKTGR